MSSDNSPSTPYTERTALLLLAANERRLSQLTAEEEEDVASELERAVSKEEQEMKGSMVGERLPYNDYTTIDWLHDLVKSSYHYRHIHAQKGLRSRFLASFDACSGWIAVVVIGALTACVAFVVDVAVATVSDWKSGYCSRNWFMTRDACCIGAERGANAAGLITGFSRVAEEEQCPAWRNWSNGYGVSFLVYVLFALLFGIISSSATMTTKRSLPVASAPDSTDGPDKSSNRGTVSGKTMYMASGSGIPEIKTILSGFTIPHFLTLHVLVVKAFGAVFAVATGMNLGKEGPFVHISTCVGYIVGNWFPKYRNNSRKLRELLSAACASGLSVAFGAPIGGVLFSYEEISTFFPRKVLWRAFLCSLVAAMVLRLLNPTGTGKLVLFETNYGTRYEVVHYVIFVVLGVAGGVFGGLFCKANYLWSMWFRQFGIIKRGPVLEVFLVVLVTALVQFPNPLTREPGDVVIKNLLVDCRSAKTSGSWVCKNEIDWRENGEATNWYYIGFLIYGTLTKLILTIITFGCKVPSGVIIPALDAGALFGRLIGQSITSISPGIFAMVGAAAFLAGVSRMTISLAVIMFELTGELEYVVPNMVAILIAKWVADAFSKEGVYDLAQSVLGHPFLDGEHALDIVRKHNLRVSALIPPKQTMQEITVLVPQSGTVQVDLLHKKLQLLRQRGLMDAGLVLVQEQPNAGAKTLQGYISQTELEFGLSKLASLPPSSAHQQQQFQARLLSHPTDPSPSPSTPEIDLSAFVDRTPLTLSAKAPIEYAVEMFAKLGLRYLCVVREGDGELVGVVLKKRLVGFLERIKEEGGPVDVM